jgi:YD repeat-containing protein
LSPKTRFRDRKAIRDRNTRRYDDVGNLLRLVDPAGHRTDWKYDGFNRMTDENRIPPPTSRLAAIVPTAKRSTSREP